MGWPGSGESEVRQVEEEVVNEMVRIALESGCTRIAGRYIPTAKNEMVGDLYPSMGFRLVSSTGEGEVEYALVPADYQKVETAIAVTLKNV